MSKDVINEAVVGKYCIVRGEQFGVFAGTVESVDGNRALLTDARRLWYWEGAASISQIAAEGVTRPDNCKFTQTVESIVLIGVIEMIPATNEARSVIESVSVWKR